MNEEKKGGVKEPADSSILRAMQLRVEEIVGKWKQR
jgi:hypothetical protein